LAAILAALRAHPDAPELADVAASAVGNLVATPGACVAALRARPGAAPAAELALRALASLAESADAPRRDALAAGAMEALFAAKEEHADSAEVRHWAERAADALQGRTSQTVYLT
jgi:hypothetical protein